MTRQSLERISTGVAGLDDVLNGGLIPGRSYLVRGAPGSGKSILGWHFLTAGTEQDESVLYVNLEEAEEEIHANAGTLGFDLGDVDFLSLMPGPEAFTQEEPYSVFPPEEVEGETFTNRIVDRIESLEPTRVFIDPVTQLRHLSSDPYQFRKQILGFERYLGNRNATVLFTSQATESNQDDDLQFLADGTIELGAESIGRAVRVPKFRGSGTQSGVHAVRITDSGMVVFPELKPGEYATEFVQESVSSGITELDDLLYGGLERGTVSVISGPTGVGKTTTGTQFMKEAASRGERSVVYLFEENRDTFITRSEAVNIPVKQMLERGTLNVEEMEPLDLSPQEFASIVRHEVETADAELVMIDGIKGYKLALQGGEERLVRHLHALGRYLKNMGVTVIFVDEVGHVTGEFRPTEVGISYLADNLVFLRHIEVRGELRKVIGVLKKRTTQFEHGLRELEITGDGLRVGEPLTDLRGILTGTPEFLDEDGPSER